MPKYQAETLHQQGWYVTVHRAKKDAKQAVLDRVGNGLETANPALDSRVRPQELVETKAPSKTFDQWCDETWPSTAMTSTTTATSTGSTSKPSPPEEPNET